jgi:protein-S-isoprenylcysteine O-methyltransferase Ste14
MKDLHGKAIAGSLRLFLTMLVAVFLPAWTFRYWQGWLCLAAFMVPASVISVWVARNDPALLERRLKAGPKSEKERGQKVGQAIAAVAFLADFAVPGFDHRFGWSHVPAVVSVIGDLVMVIGFWFVFAVFRVNTFTSGIIEVAEDQRVISTGPYSVIRHPMYSGALILLFGIPLALGSWWGLLVNLPLTAVIVWRLLDEERFLARELPGYAQYCEKVRKRLVPHGW